MLAIQRQLQGLRAAKTKKKPINTHMETPQQKKTYKTTETKENGTNKNQKIDIITFETRQEASARHEILTNKKPNE